MVHYLPQAPVAEPIYDESRCGLLFDISLREDVFDGFPVAEKYFRGGGAVCVRNMDEAAKYGIKNDKFLSGIVFYHVKSFFGIVRTDRPLYVMIADCTDIQGMIMSLYKSVSQSIYQIGIWTEQPLWSGTAWSLACESLFACDRDMASTVDVMSHLNIVYCGAPGDADISRVPELPSIDGGGVSFILGQSADATELNKGIVTGAQVGMLGFILGLLSNAGAEQDLSCPKDNNLNQADCFGEPEACWVYAGTRISASDKYMYQAGVLSAKGYIVPVRNEYNHGVVSLSGEQSTGGRISVGRVSHKLKKAVRMAVLPYIHSMDIDANALLNDVYASVSSALVNKMGLSQLSANKFDYTPDGDEPVKCTATLLDGTTEITFNEQLV